MIKGNSGDDLIFMGLTKSIMTLVKYLYQIFLNWDWKSTRGFSMINVILDFSGGLLSLLQELIKLFILDINIFTEKSNIPKFALSIIAVCFDIIFIF